MGGGNSRSYTWQGTCTQTVFKKKKILQCNNKKANHLHTFLSGRRYPISFWSRSGLLDHTVYGDSMFSILRKCQTVSKVAAPFSNPNSRVWGLKFPRNLTNTRHCLAFYLSHSCWYEMISHYGLIHIFPNNQWCWTSFQVFTDHL